MFLFHLFSREEVMDNGSKVEGCELCFKHMAWVGRMCAQTPSSRNPNRTYSLPPINLDDCYKKLKMNNAPPPPPSHTYTSIIVTANRSWNDSQIKYNVCYKYLNLLWTFFSLFFIISLKFSYTDIYSEVYIRLK